MTREEFFSLPIGTAICEDYRHGGWHRIGNVEAISIRTVTLNWAGGELEMFNTTAKRGTARIGRITRVVDTPAPVAVAPPLYVWRCDGCGAIYDAPCGCRCGYQAASFNINKPVLVQHVTTIRTVPPTDQPDPHARSEEHTSELQSQ